MILTCWLLIWINIPVSQLTYPPSELSPHLFIFETGCNIKNRWFCILKPFQELQIIMFQFFWWISCFLLFRWFWVAAYCSMHIEFIWIIQFIWKHLFHSFIIWFWSVRIGSHSFMLIKCYEFDALGLSLQWIRAWWRIDGYHFGAVAFLVLFEHAWVLDWRHFSIFGWSDHHALRSWIWFGQIMFEIGVFSIRVGQRLLLLFSLILVESVLIIVLEQNFICRCQIQVRLLALWNRPVHLRWVEAPGLHFWCLHFSIDIAQYEFFFARIFGLQMIHWLDSILSVFGGCISKVGVFIRIRIWRWLKYSDWTATLLFLIRQTQLFRILYFTQSFIHFLILLLN